MRGMPTTTHALLATLLFGIFSFPCLAVCVEDDWNPSSRHPKFKNVIASDNEGSWKPAAGYKWIRPDEKGDFLVRWAPGKKHPKYRAVASKKKGFWTTKPGYVWRDKSDISKGTVWRSGKKHPKYDAVSSSKEGNWTSKPGYIWRDPDDISRGTVWRSGRRHTTLYATSATREGYWTPDPGFVWRNKNNIDKGVVWKSGVSHPTYDALSSSTEGKWTAEAGFVWRDLNNMSRGTVWQPGRRHPKYNASAATEVRSWTPDSGYKWRDINDINKGMVATSNGSRQNNNQTQSYSVSSEAFAYTPFGGFSLKPNGTATCADYYPQDILKWKRSGNQFTIEARKHYPGTRKFYSDTKFEGTLSKSKVSNGKPILTFSGLTTTVSNKTTKIKGIVTMYPEGMPKNGAR